MIKYTHKLAIALMLCLISASSGVVGANELNKLDIKKSNSSASTLNVTVYTSNPYDENVAVTKKSDNKYVILLPNVGNSSSANVDYSSLKDVVSDVSVKSVNDGASGYTKVTLTTTKPVSISTSARKSAPLTAEQKAYKNLIAQSRIASSKAKEIKLESETAQIPTAFETKKMPTEVPSPKQAQTQVPKQVTDTKPIKSLVEKISAPKSDDAETSAVKTTAQASVSKDVKKSLNVKDKTLKGLTKEINENLEQQPVQPTGENGLSEQNTAQSQQIPFQNNSNMLMILLILTGGTVGLVLLMKFIKTVSALQEQVKLMTQQNGENVFANSLPNTPSLGNENNYKNWQEKYVNYVKDMSDDSDEKLEYLGNGEYAVKNSIQEAQQSLQNIVQGQANFVKNSQTSALPDYYEDELKIYEKPASNFVEEKLPPIKNIRKNAMKLRKHKKIEIVEEKIVAKKSAKKVSSDKTEIKEVDIKKNKEELVKSLEKAVHNSPSTERLTIDEEVIKQVAKDFNSATLNETPTQNSAPVKNEEEGIDTAIRKSPKLKAFANKVSMEKTSRTAYLPKTKAEIIPANIQESGYVSLTNSRLYKNSRKSPTSTLSVADLISKSEIKKVANADTNKAYATISVDEFFESGYKSTASFEVSSRVASRLEKLSASKRPKIVKEQEVVPQHKPEPYTSRKVRSAFNIDKNRGFYVVDDRDGNSSLIGVVKDNVTVIKNFGKIHDTSLKVINQDEKNVYMLRANGERYLVEANNDKIGVLLEL